MRNEIAVLYQGHGALFVYVKQLRIRCNLEVKMVANLDVVDKCNPTYTYGDHSSLARQSREAGHQLSAGPVEETVWSLTHNF